MSSQAPWMKFFPADFMMDTQHLTIAEVGGHIRLLCLAWRRLTVSIPNDPEWIKKHLRIDDEQYERDMLPVIREFWTEEGDDLVNDGLRKEYADMLARAERSRNAAFTRHRG